VDWIFSTILYVFRRSDIRTLIRYLWSAMASIGGFCDAFSGVHSFTRMQSILAILPLSRRAIWLCYSNNVCPSMTSNNSFFPSMGCMNHWFLKKRAMAIGIMVAGSSLGGLIWPIAISEMLANPNIGFAWASRIVALVNLPVLIVCNFILRSRLPRRDPGPIMDFKFFKDPAFSFFSAGFFFILLGLSFVLADLGMFTPLWYIQIFAQQVGISKSQAFYLLTIINGSSLPGRVLPGFYADRIGSYFLCIP
jgi:hypothetical protein